MSFAKHPRTLAIPQTNNPLSIRLSITVTGIFVWILLCSFLISGETKLTNTALRSGKTARVKVVVEAQGELQLTTRKRRPPRSEEVANESDRQLNL